MIEMKKIVYLLYSILLTALMAAAIYIIPNQLAKRGFRDL